MALFLSDFCCDAVYTEHRTGMVCVKIQLQSYTQLRCESSFID